MYIPFLSRRRSKCRLRWVPYYRLARSRMKNRWRCIWESPAMIKKKEIVKKQNKSENMSSLIKIIIVLEYRLFFDNMSQQILNKSFWNWCSKFTMQVQALNDQGTVILLIPGKIDFWINWGCRRGWDRLGTSKIFIVPTV